MLLTNVRLCHDLSILCDRLLDKLEVANNEFDSQDLVIVQQSRLPTDHATMEIFARLEYRKDDDEVGGYIQIVDYDEGVEFIYDEDLATEEDSEAWIARRKDKSGEWETCSAESFSRGMLACWLHQLTTYVANYDNLADSIETTTFNV